MENNYGNIIYWRLDRKDVIREVKVKLASTPQSALASPQNKISFNSQGGINYGGTVSGGSPTAGIISAEVTRLYLVTGGETFEELRDDKTVEYHKIKDDDKLYLLAYKWTHNEGEIRVNSTDKTLQGVEKEDTVTGIKVKIQDQMDIPVRKLKLQRGQCDLLLYQIKPFLQSRDPITAIVEGVV